MLLGWSLPPLSVLLFRVCIPAAGSSAAAGTGPLIKKGMCSCDVALQAAIRGGEPTPGHQPRRPLGGQHYQVAWRRGWRGGRESDTAFVLKHRAYDVLPGFLVQ